VFVLGDTDTGANVGVDPKALRQKKLLNGVPICNKMQRTFNL
jgi:hypothetical protein